MTTNDRAMTAPTPEQMRALADRAEILQEDSDYDYVFVTNVMVALRDAADQLEAVQRWAGKTADWVVRTSNQFDMGYNSAAGDVQAILTATDAEVDRRIGYGQEDLDE